MRKSLLLVFGIFIVNMLAAQNPQFNQPLTYFGLGELTNSSITAAQHQGSLGATYSSPYYFNATNPASLSKLKYTTFDIGVYGAYNDFELNGESNDYIGAGVTNLSFAFPIFNPRSERNQLRARELSWGMGFGLNSISTTGYDIETTSNVAGVGDVTYAHFGSGGYYKAMFSNGFGYKDFSFGVNLEYIFGNIQDSRTAFLGGIDNNYDNQIKEQVNLRGFSYSVGAQNDFKVGNPFGIHRINKDTTLTEDKKIQLISELPSMDLTVGVYGNAGNKVQSIRQSDFLSRSSESELLFGVDTILDGSKVKSDYTLPIQYGIGIAYNKTPYHNSPSKWNLGVDFSQTMWKETSFDDRPTSFNDSWRLAIGGQIVPNSGDLFRYKSRIRYRLGGYMEQDYLNVNNEAIQKYGIAFGLGFPAKLKKQGKPSFFNVGLDLGQSRSEGDFYKNNFAKLSFSFTLNDYEWFLRRKIN